MSRALFGIATVLAAGLLSGCADKSPTAPTATAPTPTATAPPPAPAPAPTPTPAPTPAPSPAPSSVRVECAGSVVRTERITCRAFAVTPDVARQQGAIHTLATIDVSEGATWSSSNGSVATVTRGQVEGLGVGTASIEAAFQGVTGRTSVEVKKNESDLIDGAGGRYLVNGTLLSNSCPNTSPLPSYAGEIVIEQAGVRTRNVQLSYDGRVQRSFRANFTASAASGELRFESDPLPAPFGSSSSVQSSRLTASSNASGQLTSAREELSCGTGAIVFRIDMSKFF